MKYDHGYICDKCGVRMSEDTLICTLIFSYKDNGELKRHYCYPCSCRIAKAVESEERRK